MGDQELPCQEASILPLSAKPEVREVNSNRLSTRRLRVRVSLPSPLINDEKAPRGTPSSSTCRRSVGAAVYHTLDETNDLVRRLTGAAQL